MTIQINQDGTIEKLKKSDDIIKIKHSKDYALNKEEREELEKLIKTPKQKIIFYLTAYAGLRRGEVAQCRLEWLSFEKFNFNGEEKEYLVINIPYRTTDIRKPKYIWKAKTRQAERTTIIFNEKISSYVLSYFEQNPKGIYCSEDYIYKVVAGKKEKYSFTNLINKELFPHSLRSTYVYILKEYGLQDNEIEFLMGWEDVRTIKNYFKRTKQGVLLSIQNTLSR